MLVAAGAVFEASAKDEDEDERKVAWMARFHACASSSDSAAKLSVPKSAGSVMEKTNWFGWEKPVEPCTVCISMGDTTTEASSSMSLDGWSSAVLRSFSRRKMWIPRGVSTM